jgi:hypothetical protein
MANRKLLLGLSFVLLSVGLTWLWIAWAGAAYERLLLAVAGPVLELFGVTRIVESPAQKRFVAWVPFVVLMWLTPGMSLSRRAAGTLIGGLVLVVAHVALVGIEQFAQSSRRPTTSPFGTLLPAALFVDALPFMIWGVVAHRYWSGLFTRVLGPSARKGAAG